MKTEFRSIVKKGNNRGTGFISIPLEKRRLFSINDQIKVIINSKIKFFSRIKFYGTAGFYVPYKIMIHGGLFGKYVDIKIRKIDGFFTSVGDDGRIYVPRNVAKEHSLKGGDIIEIESNIDDEKNTKYCLINTRERDVAIEYSCAFDVKKAKKEGIFKLTRKLSKDLENRNNILKEVLKKLNFAEIDNERVVIYYGNRVPIIVNPNINIDKIAYYLGCYFADGTKRGNSWGICASTFKQAKFYIKTHKHLIKDPKIVLSISFTDIRSLDKDLLKKELVSKWQNKAGIPIEEKRVRVINSDKGYSPNINPFGSLVLKEHRQLTQLYYNRLLGCLLRKIKKENNKNLATDFICGVLEGDGSVSAKKRGHIIITSNFKELKILEKIVKIIGFNHKLYLEGENKGYIRIWSLEIIKNIPILKDRLFRYYPKRRKILKERLAQTGCTRFLLGKSKKTSNLLIGQLNNYGILDGKGNLTQFGEKIQKDLKEFLLSKD